MKVKDLLYVDAVEPCGRSGSSIRLVSDVPIANHPRQDGCPGGVSQCVLVLKNMIRAAYRGEKDCRSRS